VGNRRRLLKMQRKKNTQKEKKKPPEMVGRYPPSRRRPFLPVRQRGAQPPPCGAPDEAAVAGPDPRRQSRAGARPPAFAVTR